MTDTDSKLELRRKLRALRADLARDNPTAAHQSVDHCPLSGFATVAGYHAIGSELNPVPLMLALAKSGARLALPTCLAGDLPLVFRLWSPGEALIRDALGVPSPAKTAMTVRPDMVIAPLLAFDRAGGRLGQGGGLYDRTLEALRVQGRVFVVGLAYAGQEVAEVPSEPHDQKLDAILTETGYIEFRKP